MFETTTTADAWPLQPDAQAPGRNGVRVKAAVERVVTGTDSLVAVRLRNKSVVSGWLSGVGEDSFQVTDPHTNAITSIPFSDVNCLAASNLVSGDTVQYGAGIRAKLGKAINMIVPGRHVTSNSFAGTTILIIGIIPGILIAVVIAKTV